MKSKWKIIIITLLLVILGIGYVFAAPVAPTISVKSNSTKTSTSGVIVNGTPEGSSKPDKAGGYIYTINLEAYSQNNRWKAYVGNVTGTFTLDDANGFTIYDWTATGTISGEIYATRSSNTISWANINCSTSANITSEEIIMNHTSNPSDNISRTFNETNNSQFYVGNVLIAEDSCYTTNTYVNNSALNPNNNFEEVILNDGTSVVYATIMEDNEYGYNTNDTNGMSYDFQMILPEQGKDGWDSSTAYYFFVELT